MTFVKSVNAIFSYFCTQFRRYQIYGNIQRNDGRTGSSVDFQLYFALLLGNLLQQTYSLVDAAIVGRFLGINALASVGASTSVVFLILGFCNGCCGGFGIPVAQKFGARDYVTMRRYVAVSLQLAAVMSVVIAVVTSIYCADILHMMSTPENIFTGAYYYLLVTFIGVPFTSSIICCPVLSVHWVTARRRFGFYFSLRY